MRQSDYQIARELKESLSQFVSIVDFQVFGSRARGDEDEYSDLDVFIEVESLDRQLKDKIRHTTWEVGLKYLMVISAMIFTQKEIEDSPLRASPLVLNIIEEGIRI